MTDDAGSISGLRRWADDVMSLAFRAMAIGGGRRADPTAVSRFRHKDKPFERANPGWKPPHRDVHHEDRLTHRPGACCLVVLAVLAPALCRAQTASDDAPKPKPNKYGTPLDTLRNTRLWTDVPPARDFVEETRPDIKGLTYTPLTGVDPVRPKPRDPANVQAFQVEMERFRAENEAKAKGLRGPAKPDGKTAKRRAATPAP